MSHYALQLKNKDLAILSLKMISLQVSTEIHESAQMMTTRRLRADGCSHHPSPTPFIHQRAYNNCIYRV